MGAKNERIRWTLCCAAKHRQPIPLVALPPELSEPPRSRHTAGAGDWGWRHSADMIVDAIEQVYYKLGRGYGDYADC